ncbi:MAG: hypothetical protein KGL39_36940 [Patescibacteria group bacterium]|nr:hypothetical protein [Patescibacteria group bacterium]
MTAQIENHQSAIVNPPFYPARPVNGGPLDKALPKSGEWLYEPKFNGWRATVHVPTGLMFNRHNKPLSIGDEFKKALAELKHELYLNVSRERDCLVQYVGRASLTEAEIEWADVEALERRHNRGRGSLVLLDLPMLDLPCKRRGYVARSTFCPAIDHCAGTDTVYSVPQYTDGAMVYSELQLNNRMLGDIPFYEGVVAKRADSPYPRQRRSPDVEFPFWMKHRWAF